MAGKIRTQGTIKIDGVQYQLLPTEQGWSYQYLSQSVAPGQTSPEEALLASSPPGFKRTVGWLEWIDGGVGPDIYMHAARVSTYSLDVMAYLSYSQGAMTDLPRKIIRPLQKRTTALSTADGRVVDFFEFAFIDGTTSLYAVQENGCVRRINFAVDGTTGRVTETASARNTSGTGNSTGTVLSGRLFTEASPPWTYTFDATLVPRTAVLIGVRSDHAIVRCYESAGVLTWEYDGDDTAGTPPVVVGEALRLTHFSTGIYSNATASGEYLWASNSPYRAQAIRNLEQEQDPFINTWSSNLGTLNLNRTLHRITGLATLRDQIIIATSAGTVYRMSTNTDGGGVPAPIIDRRSGYADPDNGRTMRIWNGHLFVPTPRGLYLYVEFANADGGTLVGVGPESIRGNTSPVRGHCVMYAGDPEWLYAAFWNGTDTYVYKGKMSPKGQQADASMVWHAVCPYIPGQRVTSMHITSAGVLSSPVLCMGGVAPGVSAVTLHAVTLPRPGKTVLSDTALLSEWTGTTVVLPDHDGLSANIEKTFIRATFTTSGMSEKSWVEAYAKVDDGPWVRVGKVQTSPVTDLPLPKNMVGSRIGFKLHFWGEESTASTFPYISAVAVDFVPNLPPSKTVDVQVFVAQNQMTITGPNQYSGMSRLQLLDSLKENSYLFSVTGPDGVDREAQFDRTAGLMWSLVDQATPTVQSGFKAQFKLNLYDDFVLHASALYEVSNYTEGTYVSYYDVTG